MRALLAATLLPAFAAAAHAGDATLSPEQLLAIAKTAYPGEVCWWERAEEDLDRSASWTLTFRYEYERESGPDRTATLYELPCFYGAYNFGSLWFLETEFEGLVPLHFAEPELDIEYADDEQTVLKSMKIAGFTTRAAPVNAVFDEETRTITGFSKWRGIADASSSGTWEFREGEFVLTRYEVDPTFDGEFNSVTVYDAAAN